MRLEGQKAMEGAAEREAQERRNRRHLVQNEVAKVLSDPARRFVDVAPLPGMQPRKSPHPVAYQAAEVLKAGRKSSSEELAIAAWSLANFAVCDPPLHRALGKEIVTRVSEEGLDLQYLTQVIWSFAVLEERHDELMAAAGTLAAQQPNAAANFSNAELVQGVWAFVALGGGDQGIQSLLNNMVEETSQRAGDLSVEELSQTCWALATLRRNDDRLFSALASRVKENPKRLSARVLQGAAWAFARMHWRDEEVLHAIAASAQCRVHEFETQGLSNLLQSLAALDHSNPSLLVEVCKDAEERHIIFEIAE